MSYVPQLKNNLISIVALKVLDLEICGIDGILKMLRGSLGVLNGVRRNNFYYLKGKTVTGQVATCIRSDDDCTWL